MYSLSFHISATIKDRSLIETRHATAFHFIKDINGYYYKIFVTIHVFFLVDFSASQALATLHKKFVLAVRVRMHNVLQCSWEPSRDRFIVPVGPLVMRNDGHDKSVPAGWFDYE